MTANSFDNPNLFANACTPSLVHVSSHVSNLAPAAEAPAPPCVAAVAGDDLNHSRWFAEEVHPHDGKLKAWLRSSFPSLTSEVDDIAQESFFRIWKRQTGKPIESVKGFLFQIARRLALDNLRRRKIVPMESLGDTDALSVMDDKPDAAQLLSYNEKVSLVAAALTRLPTRCREVFILRKFKRLSQRDIAAQLGISERTVDSQITRGMKLIEADLRAHGLDGFFYDER